MNSKLLCDTIFSGFRNWRWFDKPVNLSGFQNHFAAAITFESRNSTWNVVVYSPPKFIKQFKELKSLSKTKSLTLEYGFFWILTKGLNSINKILYSFKDEIEQKRKIPKGEEIMTLNNSNDDVSSMYWNKKTSKNTM